MSKVKTNFLTPIKGADYIAPDEIQEECRNRWRNASWTSDNQFWLEYRKLNAAEKLQYFLTHGSKSDTEGF